MGEKWNSSPKMADIGEGDGTKYNNISECFSINIRRISLVSSTFIALFCALSFNWYEVLEVFNSFLIIRVHLDARLHTSYLFYHVGLPLQRPHFSNIPLT